MFKLECLNERLKVHLLVDKIIKDLTLQDKIIWFLINNYVARLFLLLLIDILFVYLVNIFYLIDIVELKAVSIKPMEATGLLFFIICLLVFNLSFFINPDNEVAGDFLRFFSKSLKAKMRDIFVKYETILSIEEMKEIVDVLWSNFEGEDQLYLFLLWAKKDCEKTKENYEERKKEVFLKTIRNFQ